MKKTLKMQLFICHRDTSYKNYYSQVDALKKFRTMKSQYSFASHQRCVLLSTVKSFDDQIKRHFVNTRIDRMISSDKVLAKLVKVRQDFLTCEYAIVDEYHEIKKKTTQLMLILKVIKTRFARAIIIDMSNTS